MGLFRSRTETIKRTVASELNGTLVKTPPGHTVVVNDVGGWTAVFDIESPEEGPPPLFFGPRKVSRIGIPFVARDEFTWDLKRRSLVGPKIYERRTTWKSHDGSTWAQKFEEIKQGLKPPPIDFGFGDFDYEFTIETSDEAKMRKLFALKKLRELVQEQPYVRLRVERDARGWFSSLVPELPSNVAALFFQDRALVNRVQDVRELHGLLAATMKRLVAIGSAYPEPPRLRIGNAQLGDPRRPLSR